MFYDGALRCRLNFSWPPAHLQPRHAAPPRAVRRLPSSVQEHLLVIPLVGQPVKQEGSRGRQREACVRQASDTSAPSTLIWGNLGESKGRQNEAVGRRASTTKETVRLYGAQRRTPRPSTHGCTGPPPRYGLSLNHAIAPRYHATVLHAPSPRLCPSFQPCTQQCAPAYPRPVPQA